MRYKTFGRKAGLRVSEYALGTANFSTSDAAPVRRRHVRSSTPSSQRAVPRSTRPTSIKTERRKLSLANCSAKIEAITW